MKMWSKVEFDDNARAKDFLSLSSALVSVSTDITYDLAHILGKCTRNADYCMSAKTDLITLANTNEKLRISLEVLCNQDPKLQALLGPFMIKQNPVASPKMSFAD